MNPPLASERVAPAVLPDKSAGWSAAALLRQLRPKQWLKNGLLFFGLIYSLHLTDASAVGRALVGFVSFCFISSAGYIFNDFRDLAADRLHPTKRFRPLAAGDVSPRVAAGAASCLFVLGAALAAALGAGFAATCAGYALVTATYSMWWKHLVLIDLFAISSGFVIRLVAGAVAAQVGVSPWLYVCTVLGSLLIAIGKPPS